MAKLVNQAEKIKAKSSSELQQTAKKRKESMESAKKNLAEQNTGTSSSGNSFAQFVQKKKAQQSSKNYSNTSTYTDGMTFSEYAQKKKEQQNAPTYTEGMSFSEYVARKKGLITDEPESASTGKWEWNIGANDIVDERVNNYLSSDYTNVKNKLRDAKSRYNMLGSRGMLNAEERSELETQISELEAQLEGLEKPETRISVEDYVAQTVNDDAVTAEATASQKENAAQIAALRQALANQKGDNSRTAGGNVLLRQDLNQYNEADGQTTLSKKREQLGELTGGQSLLEDYDQQIMDLAKRISAQQIKADNANQSVYDNADAFQKWFTSDWESEVPETKERTAANNLQSQLNTLYAKRDTLDAEYAAARDSSDLYNPATAQAAVQRLETAESNLSNLTEQITALEAQLKAANKAADKADKAAKNDYYTEQQQKISKTAQLKGKAASDAYSKLEELQSELAEMKKNKPKSAAQALANQREKQAQAKLDKWMADTQGEADELSALLQPYADSGQLDDPNWERPEEVQAALNRSEELSRERQELQQAVDDAGSIGAKDSDESIVKSYWAQRGNDDYTRTVKYIREQTADADSPYLDPYGFYQKNKTRIDTLAADNDSFGSLTADETYFAKNYDRFDLFQFMTAAEINDYYYQLAKGGVDQAKEYLDAMEVTLDQRRTKYNQTNTEIIYGTTGTAGKVGMNALSIPANVAGGITSAVGDVLSTAEGKYNPYSPYHNLQDYANNTRSITANEISSRTYAATGSEGLANLASNTYQALMSSGDSLLGAATLGKGYTITMGLGAASQRARELYEDGASEGEIAAIALAAGAIEVITEDYSLESFTSKFLDGNITGLKSAVKNILIQSMNEASEEMVSEITNKIVDSMIRGADSDYSKDIQQIMEEQGCSQEEAERIAFVNAAVDVLWAGYGGAVSGGAMAAGGTIINATTSGARKTGKQLAESGEAESVLQNAKELGNNSKTVDKLLKKVQSGKPLSGSDYAELTNVLDSNVKAMVKADTESVKSAVQARADELGVKRSGILADAITNDLLGTDLSAKEKIVRAANKEAANQIIDELNTSLFSDTESNAWVKEIKTYRIGKGVFTAKKTAARAAAEETIESTAKETFGKRIGTVTALYNDGQDRTAYTSEMTAVYKAAQDGKAINSVKADTLTAKQKQAAYLLGQQARMATDAYSYSEDGESSYVRSTNEAVQVVGFSATGAKAVLTTADGATVNASDVVFGDYGEASLYRSISNLNIEADSANEILSQIRNGKLSNSEAAMAINDAYTSGRLGNSFSSIRESSEAGKLSEDVREAAWQAGRDAAAKNDKAKAEAAKSGKHAVKKGSLTIEQSARSIKRNAQQKTAVQAAAILRDMGLNISVYASTEADRAAGMENGCITLADGSIRVDLNAGVDGSGVMAYALSHELTHFTEEFSAEKFRTFTDILFAEMESKGVNVQNLIESKKLDAPKGYTGEKLNEWAYSEAVAEMCETMLTDTDALTRISQKLHAKDAKLWTRIKNFLQGLVERLKAAYKGLEPDSDIAKVAKETITTSEKALNAYADAVADAVENYRNGGKNAEATEAEEILKSGRQETKNLVALHNLTEDKFLKTLELGGFPMPSIAVTKADIPHTAFGDITVVFGKETIDPKANRKNAVYSADAWTPVVPNVEYEVNSSAESRISEKLGALSGKVDEEFQRGLRQLTSDIEGDMNRNGGEDGLIKKALDNYSLKAAYLEGQGKHVEVPTRQETTQVNQVSEAMQRRYAQIADVLGVTTADEAKHLTLKEARDQHGAELEQVWPGITKSALRLSTALNRIADMFDGKLNQAEARTVKDTAAARANIDRTIDSEAYEAWVRDLYQGIEASNGIYNGKERYTPAGDLKSFKAIHIPATLDGIVKAMASENGGNTKNVSGFHGVKTLRAATAQTFKSIAQMHGAQGRLQNLTQEQVDKITDTLGSSMYQVMSTIDSANEGSMSSSNNLIRMDNIGEILVEVGESGKYTSENVQAIFHEHGLNVDAQAAQKTVELLYEIAQMPVNIFEAKPARAVAFSEIKSVIVPDSASTKLLDALNEKGIPYQTYEAGHDEQRVQMVQDMDGVRFSLRGKAAPTREELEKKAPVNVVDISKAQTKGSFSERRKAILRDAQETIKKPYLNKDTGTMIFLTKKSYTHIFNNIGEVQLNAAEHLSELVENAVLTHAEGPTHGSEYADRVYTFFAAAGADEDVKPVKLKVKEYSYKAQQLPTNIAEYFQNSGGDYAGVYDTVVLAVEDIEKDLPGSARPLTDKSASMQRPSKSSTIKVADLLNLVKGDAEKYIPQAEGTLKSSRTQTTAQRDAEYMELVKDPEKNRVQLSRLVKQAAEDAGFGTQMLYHGTGRFGYTRYDLTADTASKGMIYATDKPEVAANYGGSVNVYAGQRDIGKPLMKGSSTEAVIRNAESVFGRKYHVVTDAERKQTISSVVDTFQKIADIVNEVSFDDLQNIPGWNAEDYHESIANFYDLTMDLVWTVTGEYDANENGTWEETATDYLEAALKRFEEYYPKLREAVMNNRDVVKGTTAESLHDLFRKHTLFDAAVDAEYVLLPLIQDGKTILTDGRNFREKSALAEAIDRNKDIGAYRFYGNPGGKVLEVDTKGADWLSIKAPEIDDAYHSTDFIAKWARKNGYSSVYVKNVHDGGDNANEYIFFDSNQVKSADPVTYDDDGNVIPLSERFNSKEEDIRYSSRKPNPEAYDAEEWGDGRYMPFNWDEDDTNVLLPKAASAEGIDLEDTSDLPFFFGDEEAKATSRKTKNGKTQEEKLDEIKKAQKAARKIRKQADYLQRVLRIQKSGNLEVKAAAKELIQANRVNGDVNELSSLLQSFYQKMQKGKGEDGEAYTQADMEADLNEIASWIEDREIIELDASAEEALDYLRGKKIKLNKQQLGNIKHEFGSLREFKKRLQGIVTVDQKNGIELDSRWDEFATDHPYFFRAKEKLGNSDTDTNLPAMLVDAIGSLLNSKSADQLQQDEFAGEARAALIESILEKGWNVIPEDSVTDKYRQQIRDLKQEQEKAISELEAQQRSRIAEIQAELAARLEAQKQQAYESYDRMKEIYDAERQKIAEAHKAEMNELRETYAGRTAEYQEEALNYLNSLDGLESKSEEDLRDYLKGIAEKLSDGDKDAYNARIGQYGQVINEYVDLRALDSQKDAAFKELKRRSDAQKKKAQERVESAKRKEAVGKLFRVQNQLNRMLMNPSKTLYVPDSMKNALTKAMQVLLETETNDLNGRKAKKSVLLAELAELNRNPTKNASAIAEVEEKIEKLAAKSTTVTDALQDLLTAYKQMSTENEGRFTSERDEDIAAFVYDAVTTVGGKPFYQLSSGQIEAVYQAYKAILTTIRNENKLFAENLKAGYTETAKAALGELRGQPSRVSSKGKLAETAEKFSWNNEKPIYAFMRLGSSTMTKLYQNMRSGEDSFAVDISEGQAFVTEAMKKYGYQKFEDKPLTLTSADGKQFSLNLEERMSLYAYSKREQAIDHLTEGGIVLAENETETKGLFGRKKKVQNEDFNSYRLTKEQAQAIRDSNLLQLTKEQQAFADEMQSYLSTICAAKNNEVSLKLYGVTKFHEKFYWPIKSSGIFSESIRESQERTGNKQKNAGFTKGTVKHARNPINLNGFMETWSQHVINTAMYHSFTLPMEDFYRVYNYKENAKGTEVRGLRQEILAKHGAAATGYIDQFLKDVNGGVRADPRSSAVNMLLGGFKKAAVSASLSVAIQQPSAVGRSFAYINPQYFFGAKVDSVGGINKTWEEMKQYAPVTILKEMGRFDVGVSAGTKDMLMNGKKGFLENMDEWFGKAPEFMDKITWVAMWNACKRQTKAQNKSLTGEALKQEAGKLFTKVITETQVYDSTFSRSGNMRSKDTGMTMLTAFMAEPTTTANMVTQALRDWKQGYKGKATRAVTAVGAATILNSILASLVYASRDDDEDKTWLEKYLKSLVSELLDGANPLGYIPGVKDIWSLFQGYDVERSDMSLWAEVVDQTGSFVNATKSLQSTDPEDEEAMTEAWKTFGEKSADAAASVLNLFGIPLKNILREVGGAKNIVNEIQNPKKQDAATIGHAMWEGFNEYLPDIFQAADGKTQEVYKAVSSGSEAWIERVKSTYASEDKFNTAVVNALKTQDGRIRQIAQAQIDGDSRTESKLKKAILSEGGFTEDQIDSAAEKQRSKLKGGSADSLKEMYLNGEITASEAKNRLVSIVGKKADSAEDTVSSWQCERDTGIAYSDMKDAYIGGELSQSKAEQMLIKYGGKSEDAAETQVLKWQCERDTGVEYDDLKDAYLDGDITGGELTKALQKYGGKTEEEAAETLTVCQWQKQHPSSTMTASQISKYTTTITSVGGSPESLGISEKTYQSYLTGMSKCTGTDTNNDGKTDSGSKKAQVLALIDSLDLTSAQKDALYYSEGYAASKLKRAPWH